MDFIDPAPRSRRWLVVLVVSALAVLLGGRWIAELAIDWQWWGEIGQRETWLSMLAYGTGPALAAALVVFAVFFVAHARGLKAAGTSLSEHPLYARLSGVGLLLAALVVGMATVDSWTVVRFFGGTGAADLAGAWHDPVFGRPLSFYFFDLPFYGVLLRTVLALSLGSAFVYWLTARGWILSKQAQELGNIGEGGMSFDLRSLNLGAALEGRFFRIAAGVFFLALAARFYFDRFDLLFEEHGALVGVDWVDEHLGLPLLGLNLVASLVAAAAFFSGRLRYALLLPAAFVVYLVVPYAAGALYVRPSEITIQKPYIERHIQATREAWGLSKRVKESEFDAQLEVTVDPNLHKPLLENVRLWDWRAFHDTITQIQALRLYYTFVDTDVDRYKIDGRLRQVLLTPRELDVRQLPADARARWINPHFIYTHGYGVVMAEASKITSDGLPQLLVKNTPPEIMTPSLKLTRPELYYGEATHEPVFVRTGQPEFNYPFGASNVESRYEGKGGFPVSSLLERTAAAVAMGDWNILLTSYLTPESRMMIRRNVHERIAAVAGFLSWDPDPYLVMTPEGRLVWIMDGYTTSSSHPYSKLLSTRDYGEINYMRNAVKATIDAYDGKIHLYAFDTQDPILRAYRKLFPHLIEDVSSMPPALREHARYPEAIFKLQAEIYRTYHMTNAEAFFNKEDVWDVSRSVNGTSGTPEPMSPTYMVASLPDSDEPEFLLMTSFTPRNKPNLIGLMMARCDGEHLGELNFLQLPKSPQFDGPIQIESKISQDQTISKDLTLWNQQGSQVLRGQMLVLPIANTLLYIEPIYIQASQSPMPQLKKIAMYAGGRLIYTDTYEQAVAELAGFKSSQPATAAAAAPPGSPKPAATQPSSTDAVSEVRDHLRKYRELMSQGKYADAGKEIEALERMATKR
jgi:uncharacterized membrane protein (UPF0182 family)